MPLSEKDISEDVVTATANVFDSLLCKKANELIEKYKDIQMSGEYL